MVLRGSSNYMGHDLTIYTRRKEEDNMTIEHRRAGKNMEEPNREIEVDGREQRGTEQEREPVISDRILVITGKDGTE